MPDKDTEYRKRELDSRLDPPKSPYVGGGNTWPPELGPKIEYVLTLAERECPAREQLVPRLKFYKNMLQSYESGDPYMSFAILAGAAPSGASKSTHPTIRRLYKTASLAISYGQEVHALAARAKVPLCTAERVFADYERLYHRFLSWRSRIVDNF